MSKTEEKEKNEAKDLVKETVVEAVPLTVEEGRPDSYIKSDLIEILVNLNLIGKAVINIEPRFTIRVLRTLTTLRKRVTKSALRGVLEAAFPKGCEWAYKVHLLTSQPKLDKP